MCLFANIEVQIQIHSSFVISISGNGDSEIWNSIDSRSEINIENIETIISNNHLKNCLWICSFWLFNIHLKHLKIAEKKQISWISCIHSKLVEIWILNILSHWPTERELRPSESTCMWFPYICIYRKSVGAIALLARKYATTFACRKEGCSLFEFIF